MTRDEAIKYLETFHGYDLPIQEALNMAIEALERKRGKWIRITQGAMPEQYMCPFCHRTVEVYGVEELLPIRYPYCHCGADMRGERKILPKD